MPHPIALLRHLQKVIQRILHRRQLMFLRPIPNILEITALVFSIEVDESLKRFAGRLVPNLAEHADVDGAH